MEERIGGASKGTLGRTCRSRKGFEGAGGMGASRLEGTTGWTKTSALLAQLVHLGSGLLQHQCSVLFVVHFARRTVVAAG